MLLPPKKLTICQRHCSFHQNTPASKEIDDPVSATAPSQICHMNLSAMSQSTTRLGNISFFPPQFLSSTSSAWIYNTPYLRQPAQTQRKDVLPPSLDNSLTNGRKLTQSHRINIYSVRREDVPCAFIQASKPQLLRPGEPSTSVTKTIALPSRTGPTRISPDTFIGTSQCLLSRDSLVAP
jgi:hypothetical protein